ncbi:MAG: glutamine--scyllo-inositol aminotransferase [Spirochaetae bacterium HGW-Spirochaetae-8]|jgi:dTDP-4-amino-4,6-dideoxygalactose transaminase|nr:MAG: glutamine--scyllo-inositol aminotransferase [Spirochaetae bacterium HGW-Spirochaetae-8]
MSKSTGRLIPNPLPTIANRTGRLIGEEELQQLREVIESGTLAYIYGTKVWAFEKEFRELLGSPHSVAVSSGTAALHTSLVYLNPEPGDEIIVSPITDMGTVIPILYQQAIPVFADIDPAHQNMDPKKIENLISERTKAIMVTHIHGIPADLDPIMEIAQRYNLKVVEDCAQAHMATYHGHIVGTIGDLGCFSFQQSKHITTGDGGMVVSKTDMYNGRALRLCFDKGWPRDLPGRDHLFLAPNYHMTELQAAVGIAQIRKYPTSINIRRDTGRALAKRLDACDLVTTFRTLPDTTSTFFGFGFKINLPMLDTDGESIAKELRSEGLKCELGYPGKIPLYLYPMIREEKTFGTSGLPFTSPSARKRWKYEPGLCPVAEQACQETIMLPWNEGMRDEHVELIAHAIITVLERHRR